MMLIPFFIAFFVTLLYAPLLRSLAILWNVVDQPAVRKIQKKSVPLLGGAAVYLGVMSGMLFFSFHDLALWGLLLGSTLIFIVSLIDDKKKLSAVSRLIAQIAAASILVVFGARIEILPKNFTFDIIETMIAMIWILGVTNAFNYLDGLDGLCSGLAAISSFFFFVILLTTGQKELVVLSLALMGASLGFMPHNLKKEKMFLGDAGSMFIGFVIAGASLIGVWASDNIIKISVPILILGVPIFDMIFTTVLRIKEKKIKTIVQWFEYAGRDHFHHYLMDLGFHQHGAVLFIFSVNIAIGLSALIIAKSNRNLYAILAILESMIIFFLIGVLMVLGRRLHKENQVRERMGF